jgi:hypothetical protein
MPLILGTNSIKDTGYNVANSCRFDGATNSDECLIKTFGTATSRKKFTYSVWVKLSGRGQGNNNALLVAGTSGQDEGTIKISPDVIDWSEYSASSASVTARLTTTQVFRDYSAWSHLVFVWDSGNATAGNRMRIYHNGSEITSFSTDTNPSEDQDAQVNNNVVHNIGRQSWNNSGEWNGYMAEACFIDGQALDPTSFGEFDSATGIWKPIDVSGLTFGNNGFYLEFKQSGTGTNALGIGADTSGNTNHFAVNNLTAVSQSTDTCTNNYATLNSLDNYYTPHTLTEGLLKQTTDSTSGYAPNLSTVALTQGKWYFEVKYVSRSSSDNYNLIGIKSTQITNTNYLGQNQHDYGYYSDSGNYYTNNAAVTYGDSYDQGDIIGCYLDLDNNKLYFAKNGTVQNSGTGISITDPASTPLGYYFFAVGDYGQSLTIVNEINFGSPVNTISSGNADPNGYGNFEYDPSSGTFDGASKSFYALNTKNLAEYG